MSPMVSCIHCIPKRTSPEVIDLCQGLERCFYRTWCPHVWKKNNKKHMIPIAYIRIGCQWSPMFFLSLHLLRLRWTELRRGSKRLECEARIVKYGRKRGKRTAAVTSIVVFPSWHFHWIFMVQNIKRINPPALLMCIALPLKQGVPCFVLGVQNVAKQRWKQKETNWNDMYIIAIVAFKPS